MAKDSDFFGAFRPRRSPDARPRPGEEPRGATSDAGRPPVRPPPVQGAGRPPAAPPEEFLLAVEPPEPLGPPRESPAPRDYGDGAAPAPDERAGSASPTAAPVRPGGTRVWRAAEAPDLATLSGAGRFVPPVPVLSASATPGTAGAGAAPAAGTSAAGGRKMVAPGARAEEDFSSPPPAVARPAATGPAGRPGSVRAPAEAADAAPPAEAAERMIVLSVWEVLLVAVLVALLMGVCFQLGRRSGHPGLRGATSTATGVAPADASVTPPPVPSAESAGESGRSR